MSQTRPASRRSSRRRDAGAGMSSMAQDFRYQPARSRRKLRLALPQEVLADGWPEGFVRNGLIATMLAISAYHHAALLAAVGIGA
ncbi:MAG TPA: hypothetical protein VFV11_03285 [Solimonas sp.]|nr:hypothetical protein [Solimonas sp.]